MKALVWEGPYDVRIEERPRPRLKDPEDVLLRVTTTAICGSDLHIYHGAVSGMAPGQVLGHEFMGIVEEAGPEVHEVGVGERVVVPFNISCGRCWFCRHGYWSQCDRSNPRGQGGAAYGYTQKLGGYDGGQAEYVRVPYGNTGPLKVPDGLADEQVLFLSDILCTGYFGVDIAEVRPGDDVVVFGAGPVGYFTVLSAFLKGAGRVWAVDRVPARLKLAEALGAIPINFDTYDPIMLLQEATGGRGAVCIDCVGYEAVGHRTTPQARKQGQAYPNENPLQVINWITQVARKYSAVGIPGVYQGSFDAFPFGEIFNRELQLHMGQCPVKRYNEQLLKLIVAGRIDPTPVISHVMDLADAPEAYAMFDKKGDVTKVVLKTPAARERRESMAFAAAARA